MDKGLPLVFTAIIEIIGVNPFVFIPEKVLQSLFEQAKKDKGAIPVRMTIDGHSFTQTLVKYSGHWRLYLNTPMRKAAGKECGETAIFTLVFDPQERGFPMHAQLQTALENTPAAKAVFDALSPSLQQEIVRYIARLKTDESVAKNVIRAINFLLGKERFIGRVAPR